MRPLSKSQKEFLERHKKLKQEHAEMVEYLKDLSKSHSKFETYSLEGRLEQLLYKIEQNEKD